MDWLKALANTVRATRDDYPNNRVSGCPIPFFGDVIKARVLTVGVNPSNMEFAADRQWLEPMSQPDWQKRLLNYFNLPGVPAHGWFETWSMGLEFLDLCYAAGSAVHIDISPRPTIPMLDDDTDKPEFRAMVEHDAKWFFELLGKLPQVQLLLVAGPIPRADGRKQQLASFIQEHAGEHGCQWLNGQPLPKLITPSHPEGVPVFVCPYEPKVDGLYAIIRQVYRHRELLQKLSAPRNQSVPILPDRLNWPSAIGNYLLNFGNLDHLVFVFLKDHLSADDFARVRDWHLKDRLNRIAKWLEEANYPAAEQATYAELIARLEPFRELRNRVAHGHIWLGIEQNTRKPKQTVFQPKDLDTAYLPEARHLEIEELIAGMTAIGDLIQEFERLNGFKVAQKESLLEKQHGLEEGNI